MPRKLPSRIIACAALAWLVSDCGSSAEEQSPKPATPPPEFHASYVADILANVSGGQKTGAAYDGLFKLSLQLHLDQVLRRNGWKGASLFASALYPHGGGLTNSYTRDLNGVSSIDGYDSLRLNELWLDKSFGEQASLRAGLLAVDTEFFACDSGSLFLNGCFGALPIIEFNFEAPAYPLTSPGVRLALSPADHLTIRGAILSGDVGTQNGNNQHGGRGVFNSRSGVLFLAEATYQSSGKLPGTFTLGGFYHSGKFTDLDGGGSRADEGGLYLVIDQALSREPPPTTSDASVSSKQGLHAFCRLGVTFPDSINVVSHYVEAGLTYDGLLPGRDQDSCGIAFSYTRVNPGSEDTERPYEVLIEATYQVVLNDRLSIQPDLQYIANPGATGQLSDAWVAGVRLSLAY
ncbi:MAG: carbohydrate porin [Chthoniobacteraceae bacterium]